MIFNPNSPLSPPGRGAGGEGQLVNLQNRKGKAKPYQVRQFLEIVEQYNLELGDEA